MVERFLDQLTDVVVGELVVDEVAVAARRHDAGKPKLGEMLRDGCRSLADANGEFVDARLSFAKRPDDVKSGAIGEHGERLHGQLDLMIVRGFPDVGGIDQPTPGFREVSDCFSIRWHQRTELDALTAICVPTQSPTKYLDCWSCPEQRQHLRYESVAAGR